MGKIYAFEGIIPAIDPTAFVHPDAVIIGDVVIGARCYIGPCASLRGDFGRITVGAGSNVQDTCVIHSFPQTDVVLEQDSHIGHGAVLHGCTIGRNALIGMNAVVMDRAEIGENCIVAATAFVRGGFKVEANRLIAGVPAKVMREVSEDEIRWKSQATLLYQQLAQRSAAGLREAVPLTSLEEAHRRRTEFSKDDAVPLTEFRNTTAPER